MVLADREAPATTAQGSYELDFGTGVGEFKDIPSMRPLETAEDWDHIFAQFNLDPQQFEVVGDTVRCSTWQQSKRTDNGDRDVINLYSYRALFRRRMEAIDLPALTAAVQRTRIRPVKPTPSTRVTHVVYGDPQWGKSGSRGELTAILERMEQKRDALDGYMRSRPAGRSFFWDAGDGVENIHSVAAQLGTNNLSLPKQVDAYAHDMWQYLTLMAKFGPIETVICPSNHAQWRRGKELLGLPTDDWGVHVHERIADKASVVAGMNLTAHFPDDWDEAVSVDIGPIKIGLIHGHQARSLDRVPEMWKSHTHGNGPLHDVDVLISGHWHVPKLTFTGRSPRTGKSKLHIGAATLDNGSDWWRNIDGSDADPGLIVFQTDENGFDLTSFAIL